MRIEQPKNPITFTMRTDPHRRLRKFLDIGLLCAGFYGLGFLSHKLITDKFERRNK